MYILSWNVNGLRAVMKKDGLGFIDAESPDILCLQEIKLQEGQIDPILPRYPHQLWNYARRKGYSGTAVFSKTEPLAARMGMNDPDLDGEGRLITLEYPSFHLVNVYTPNAQRELARLDHRVRWDAAFLDFLGDLQTRKPVVLCGDLNVAHRDIDLARPADNRNNAGFTDQERDGFSRLLASGFIDAFRELYPEEARYTWWSYLFRAREKNIGWRIDYFVISAALRPFLDDALILDRIPGSDHCPVGLRLNSAAEAAPAFISSR